MAIVTVELKFLSVTTSMIISALKSGFGRDALEMSRKINVSANLQNPIILHLIYFNSHQITQHSVRCFQLVSY